MEPRLSFVTLGVADLEVTTSFYEEVLGMKQISDSPAISFFELGRTWLSLFPREALAEDAGVPQEGEGFRGFTLGHNVRSKEEVDQLLEEVKAKGGKIIKPGKEADWGGYSGYFADPDGVLWEVAWNPGFPHV